MSTETGLTAERLRERIAEKLWNEEQLVPWSRVFGNPDWRHDLEVHFERVDELLAEVSPVLEQLLAERDAFKAELADVHHDLKLAAGEAYTTAGSAAFEVMRLLAEARAAIERVQADVIEQQKSTGATKDPWKLGVYAQASRTRSILRDALDAPQRPEDTREETGR